jgi:hypothetical protein
MDDRQCRICFDAANGGSLVSPCRCRGTQAYIHVDCLQSYLRYYPDGICRVCRAYMRRIHSDELLYGIGAVFWCCMLAYASGLPPEPRFVYLLLTAGVLSCYFTIQRMQILAGLGIMWVSALLLFLPFAPTFQWIVVLTLSLIVTTLCLYVPLHFLMLAMAIVIGAIYSFAILMYALVHTSPPIVSIFVCGIAYLWYAAIRARPPIRNL